MEYAAADPSLMVFAEITYSVCSGDELNRYLQTRSDATRSEKQHPSRSGWLTHDLRWLRILRKGLRHVPFLIQAVQNGQVVGQLPLALVSGPIFGRFLVGLPYVNSGGVQADSADVAARLIEMAVDLSEQHDCRYLELRHERRIEHPAFNGELTSKVHMRLPLPADEETLWKGLKAGVRNQIRKGQRYDFRVQWGGEEVLSAFYDVFARRMRDLGTPVYSRRLFAAILSELRGEAEICVVWEGSRAIAAALLLHGCSVTEVPSAAARVEYNSTNVNMLMYWHLLVRSVERGRQVFDFGRCTLDGPTHRFKKQWGAQAESAVWQYSIRRGSISDMRPESGHRQVLVRAWQHLPVWLTRMIGPEIVRGIP
ncbi:MAG: FemAB family PEP-CTERM system-associated protein [Planctomycetaceae bacterium]|nr:FemAB family PEP-CTERM system-associated protein [Planctomycetaceae bacterium]